MGGPVYLGPLSFGLPAPSAFNGLGDVCNRVTPATTFNCGVASASVLPPEGCGPAAAATAGRCVPHIGPLGTAAETDLLLIKELDLEPMQLSIVVGWPNDFEERKNLANWDIMLLFLAVA